VRKRPKIGLLSPYWSFWEGVVDGDPRALHTALFDEAIAVARGHGDVAWSVRVDELDDSLPTVDLIIVVVTMASPPAAVRAFLESRPRAIVVVWALHDSPAIDEPFTHQSITTRGATVGASMVAASLSRVGIAHDIVLGDPTSARVDLALRCAAAAAAVRGSRLLVVGEPLEGYDFVLPPRDEVARLGVDLISRTPDDLAAHADSASPRALAELEAEIGPDVSAVTTEAGAQVALRAAVALQHMVELDDVQGGALNCHVPSLRTGTRWGGVAPCLALGRMTSQGCGFTCTGDVNTALAMLLVSSLGRPTFYHEMEAIDEDSDEVVLANSGEHDSRFASVSDARIVANPWFPGTNPTPIVAHQVAPGPASIVAVTVVDETLRVIVAEGEFTARPTHLTGTMTAAFRFSSSSAPDGWQAWVAAGAGHHACATDAHLTNDLTVVTRHLGLDLVIVP
jgi:L-arabinose isomerase